MSLSTTLPSGGIVVMNSSTNYAQEGPSQLPAGTRTVLIQDGDPALESAIAHYRGLYGNDNVGIWTDPNGPNTGDPIALATQCATQVQKYALKVYGYDVEYKGTGVGRPQDTGGNPPTQGWLYNDALMSQTQQLGVLDKLNVLAVLPEPMMGDPNVWVYNYQAYTNRGCQVWHQCYGGTSNQNVYPPDQVCAIAVQRGVPADRILPILAPNQLALDWAHAGVFGPPPFYRGDYFGTQVPQPPPPAPTPIQLRDQAKALLDQAIGIYKSQGKSDAVIQATRIWTADQVLDPSQPWPRPL